MPARTRAAHSAVAVGLGERVAVAVALGIGTVGVGDATAFGAHAERRRVAAKRSRICRA